MRHPAPDVLRRLREQPSGVSDPDRRHVAGCPQCLAGLADPGVAHPVAAPSRAAGRRRPAVAALAVGLVVTGAGAAAANDWMPALGTQQVAPVALRASDLVALPDLRAYGDVAVTGDPEVREVPDAATAAARTGLAVPTVGALPRGITGEPVHSVVGRVGVTFTVDTARAARTAAGAGGAGTSVPAPPPGLDGSAVRLAAGPGLAQVWRSAAGTPALVVARAVAPTASSTGVPFATARDYLLSLPGVPDDVADRLRTFDEDGSTLPLPVPADRVTTSTARVGGAPATVLATRDETFAAVVWVREGVVTVVAGALGTDEVLRTAEQIAGGER